MFSSPLFGCHCVGLGVACIFDVFLIRYDATFLYEDLTHVDVEVGMIRSRGCSKVNGSSVFVCDEAIIDASETIWMYPSMFTCLPRVVPSPDGKIYLVDINKPIIGAHFAVHVLGSKILF